MAKKIYHLTISYDESDDTIEYICETLDEEVTDYTEHLLEYDACMPGGLKVVKIDISKYFDEPVLKLLRECNEMGEA